MTARATEEAGVDGRQYDVGILLVHGIGNQKKGSMLISWANDFYKEVKKQTADAAIHYHAKSDDDRLPSRLRIDMPDGKRVLLAEGSWADAFEPPPVFTLLRWTLRATVWVNLLHVDERFRRASIRLLESDSLASLLYAGFLMFQAIIWLFIGILFAPLVVGLLIVVAVLNVIPYAPIREFTSMLLNVLSTTVGDSLVFTENHVLKAAIRARLEARLRWARESCDKLIVLAHSQGAAVVHDTLRATKGIAIDHLVTFGSGLRKLQEMENRHDYPRAAYWCAALCVLLAVAAVGVGFWAWLRLVWQVESQLNDTAAFVLSVMVWPFVTAICALALRWVFEEVVIRLTGDGFRSIRNKLVANVSALAVVVLATWLMVRLDWWAPLNLYTVGLTALLGGSFTCLIAWRYLVQRGSTSEDRMRAESAVWEACYDLPEVMRWDDVYARLDPVSNGPIMEHHKPARLHTHEISNTESVMGDHNSYWSNRTQFVMPLVRILMSHLNGVSIEEDTFNSCGKLSRSHDFSLRIAHLFLVLIVPLLVLGFEWNPSVTFGLIESTDIALELSAALALGWHEYLLLLGRWLLGYVLVTGAIVAMVAGLSAYRRRSVHRLNSV